MTDKVQRIRNEIKRLKNQYMASADDFHSLGMEDKRDHYAVLASVMEAILNFIDSLQEEPETKFKIGDRIRLKGTTVKGDVIKNIYNAEDGNVYFEFENSDDALVDDRWELVEEPKKCMFTKEEFTEEDRKILCEDCEEACEYAKKEEPVSDDLGDYINELSKQFPEVSFAKLSRIAVRVAKWQKEKDFQYVKKECERTTSCCDDDIAIEAQRRHPYYYTSDIEAYANIGFKEGAMWQKEQMIAKAVEVTVQIDAGGYPYIPQMELYDYDKDMPLAKKGDKYKVVLIKYE